jgi:two-component system, probable response regulator PhcQ
MTENAGPAPVILFVDDEANAVKYFQRAIGSLAPVITASSVAEGKRMLDRHGDTLAVLVSDQRMPGEYGNELLFYAREHYPHMVRILTTAYSELEHTVEAVNQGQIHRYIQKPWDIAALRMELNQALEYAHLRREHAQLLREKMSVRQKQTVMMRIAMLQTLCLGCFGESHSHAIETYLAAVLAVGMVAHEPDWRVMDYSDLLSAEAMRNGAFMQLVSARLSDICQMHPDSRSEQWLGVLCNLLPGRIGIATPGMVILSDEKNLTEFLAAPSVAAVSPEHAVWFAFLLWLDRQGGSLQIVRTDSGLQCRLISPDELTSTTLSHASLADWMEQF